MPNTPKKPSVTKVINRLEKTVLNSKVDFQERRTALKKLLNEPRASLGGGTQLVLRLNSTEDPHATKLQVQVASHFNSDSTCP